MCVNFWYCRDGMTSVSTKKCVNSFQQSSKVPRTVLRMLGGMPAPNCCPVRRSLYHHLPWVTCCSIVTIKVKGMETRVCCGCSNFPTRLLSLKWLFQWEFCCPMAVLSKVYCVQSGGMSIASAKNGDYLRSAPTAAIIHANVVHHGACTIISRLTECSCSGVSEVLLTLART